MLIFTRKAGQRIRIRDDIEINILEIKKGFVKIGINAPKGLPIHREEVYQRIINENKLAATSTLSTSGQLDDIKIMDES